MSESDDLPLEFEDFPHWDGEEDEPADDGRDLAYAQGYDENEEYRQ